MLVGSRLLHVALSATLGAALVLPSAEEAKNPLLSRLDETLTPWEAIEVRHIVPAVRKHLADAKKDFKAMEEKVSQPGFKPSFENLVVPYRQLGEPLDKAYHVANHLKSVRDSKELREAINEVRPDVIEYSEGVGQSKPMYSAFKALSEDKEAFANLTAAQKREVEQELQSFEMSGVGLDDKTQEEFNNISQRMSILSNTFSENVIDSTKAWRKLVDSPAVLRGLPEAPLQLAAEAAKREAASLVALPGGRRAENATLADGPYLLTLDGPTAGAVMTYVEDSDLRKEVYIASASMASELNGPDNTEVVKEILKLRQREAEILGFKTYAEMSMQRKMATVESATKLLEDLRATAYPKAVDDLKDLKDFARKHGATGELKHWDANYWSHKQTKEKFDIDAEELRPYFPLDSALEGLFGLAGKMLGVKVAPADGPKWHKDVLLFEVRRNAGDKEPTARLYMDLFARPSEKRAGGWQMSLQDYDAARGKKPVSVIVTSFRPPVGDKPALLSFGEVHTLFHEFGHATQSMLTTQEEPAFAGISGVEWDAVELPSQFMEYWLDEADWVVKSFAKHYKTGEAMPEKKFNMLKAAMKHHPGMGMLGQLHMSMVDLNLHSVPLGPNETATSREDAFSKQHHTKLMESLPQARAMNSFSHIFAGGYAAGYYSYKWADVLSADAFSRFQEEGGACGDLCSAKMAHIGREWAKTVLGEGGGRKALDVFKSFRGREPSAKALLRFNFGE